MTYKGMGNDRKNKKGEERDGFDKSNPYSKTGAALYFIDISSMLW